MEKSIKERLLSAKTYDEAYKIVETTKLGVSGHELLKTAFSIQGKQPTIANQFLNTVIQEIDGGESHESSSTDGLEKVGTEEQAPEEASELIVT